MALVPIEIGFDSSSMKLLSITFNSIDMSLSQCKGVSCYYIGVILWYPVITKGSMFKSSCNSLVVETFINNLMNIL